MNIRKLLAAAFVLLLASVGARAADSSTPQAGQPHAGHGTPGHTCAHSLILDEIEKRQAATGKIHFEGSGRDGDVADMLANDAQVIYDTATKLGMWIPPQRILQSDPADMVSITATGLHPAPHWFDGMMLARGASGAGGILEIVFPGKHDHTQFVRDTNSRADNQTVYAHVAGHHDVYMNNPLFRRRSLDPMAESYRLAKRMSELKQRYPVEVADLYHRLLSFPQDFARGTLDTPESFAPGNPRRLAADKDRANDRAKAGEPSRSVLQSVVQNMPYTTPDWAKEFVANFERAHRHTPSMVHSKVMHEGWATFAEYMVLAHTPFLHSDNAMQFAELMHAVRRPSLSNPYWLGTEAWWRLWEEFLKRPEIAKLPLFEQHKAFVAEAHQVMQRTPNDVDFLRLTLDDTWIQNLNFYLYREVDSQVDGHGGDFWSPERFICVTRDPARIREFLINKVANRLLHFPEIAVRDLHEPATGGVLLEHRVNHDVPLKRKSLPKALFQLAKTYGRSVSIDTIWSPYWEKRQPPWWGRFGFWPPWFEDEGEDRLEAADKRPRPIRITVDPHGQVTVVARDVEGRPVLEADKAKALRETFQKSLDDFVTLMSLSSTETRDPKDPDFLMAMAPVEKALLGGSDGATAAALRLGKHVPTASEAFIEYLQESKLRLDRLLDLIAKGKWKVNLTRAGKMRVHGVLPEVPEFELDHRVLTERNRDLKHVPVSENSWMASTGLGQMLGMESREKGKPESWRKLQPFDAVDDEDLRLAVGIPGEHNPLPRDRWGEFGEDNPGDQGGIGEDEGEGDDGEGDGDGDGEGDDGDEGEGESDGQGGGGGGGSYVDLPLEDWIKVLRQRLQFPNLRPTRGGDATQDSRFPETPANNPDGPWLIEETAEEIYTLGHALAKQRPKGSPRLNPKQIFQLGLKGMTEDQIVTQALEPQPEPINQAVVVWMADTSGSMGGDPLKLMRTQVYNERALLLSEYPKLAEVFILYDTVAREVKTEGEFFKLNLGGGTDCVAALKLTLEILAQRYPKGQFNRFLRHFSDGIDNDVTREPVMREILEALDYVGYSHIDPRPGGTGWGSELSNGYQRLERSNPDKVGFALLSNDFSTVIQTLVKFYGARK